MLCFSRAMPPHGGGGARTPVNREVHPRAHAAQCLQMDGQADGLVPVLVLVLLPVLAPVLVLVLAPVLVLVLV